MLCNKFYRVLKVMGVLVALLFSIIMGKVLAQSENVLVEVRPAEEDARHEEVVSIKTIEGRIDSIRDEKVVITYEPEDQVGVTLQTFFLRNNATQFGGDGENVLKPGDIVSVTYQESKWMDKKERPRVERIAKNISLVRTRDKEELRQKGREKKEMRGPQPRVSQEGPQ
jgi:hypothetical protein